MTPEQLRNMAAGEQESRRQYQYCVRVCLAAGCLASHANHIKAALEAEVREHGLEKVCQVKGTGCMGLCAAGPLVSVEAKAEEAKAEEAKAEGDNRLYREVTPPDAPDIMQSLHSSPVQRLACPADLPFFQRQVKLALENAGRIDPERIEEYIAADGYAALLQALTTMTPQQVIEEVTRSGLRGRGGAGYPTGLKWSTVAKAVGERKFVICNADEGDPGAFMDRSILESDPQRVLEGMAVAAYAVGASQGYIYIRAEYPLAAQRLQTAISEAEQRGLLGHNIANTTFSFPIAIRFGAGAYVCGEETALIASIEGGRSLPRPRPPYPAQEGLWGCPTLINNVETFANIAPIIRRGGDWFAGIGTARSKGTKVFALSGQINHTGVVEVPMGVTLREIIFDIGGGIPGGRRFKAVQTGGASGGCLPEQLLDMPVDYESLIDAGSIMGSGGMIVMDESTCMVDVARFFMEFCMSESCGKCIPCRVGTAQMYDLLCKMADGTATLDDLALLEEMCDMVKHTSLCGLGQSAPNPVLSTLRYFRDEYLAHIVDKRCPAGVCRMLPFSPLPILGDRVPAERVVGVRAAS